MDDNTRTVLESLWKLSRREWWVILDLAYRHLACPDQNGCPRINASFSHVEEEGIDLEALLSKLRELGLVHAIGSSQQGLFGTVWEFNEEKWKDGVRAHIQAWTSPRKMFGKRWDDFEEPARLTAEYFGTSVDELRTTVKGSQKGWARDCLVYVLQLHARHSNSNNLVDYIGWKNPGSVKSAVHRVVRCRDGDYSNQLWDLRMLLCHLALSAKTD